MVQGHGINDMSRGWRIENEWNKIVYRKWERMLYRCYNEDFHKTEKGKCYIGCTVCERWLVLSNFIEDVRLIEGYDEEKFLNGELELDKDKKSNTDDKHYYFNYCTWLSRPENQALAFKGKHHTEEAKQKISEAQKGKQLSEETKQKISENHAKPMKGKFGSDNPSSKQVAQYDKQTLELIKIWDSMIDVQRELGIARSNISNCCKGNRKSAGGFVWKYVGSEEDEN